MQGTGADQFVVALRGL